MEIKSFGEQVFQACITGKVDVKLLFELNDSYVELAKEYKKTKAKLEEVIKGSTIDSNQLLEKDHTIEALKEELRKCRNENLILTTECRQLKEKALEDVSCIGIFL